MVLYMLGKHSATSYFLKPFEFGDRRGTNRNGEEEREGPTRVEKGNGKDQQEFRRRGRRSERVEREWGGEVVAARWLDQSALYTCGKMP